MAKTEALVQTQRATVLDLLDRLLGKGVVAYGDVILSVADLDLVYLNLRAVLSAIGTLEKNADCGVRSAECEDWSRSHAPRGNADETLCVSKGVTRSVTDCIPTQSVGMRMKGGEGQASGFAARRGEGGTTRQPANPRTPDFPKAVSHLENLVGDHRGRLKLDPEKTEQGLAKLVLTLINLLRRLMERQAIRRMEAGTLTSQQMERAGLAFLRLDQKLKELAGQFGLKEEDLNLDLGPLGELV